METWMTPRADGDRVAQWALAHASAAAAQTVSNERIEAACAQACRAIAPAWPLDRAIAVNPHWERIEHSVRSAAARIPYGADSVS